MEMMQVCFHGAALNEHERAGQAKIPLDKGASADQSIKIHRSVQPNLIDISL